MNLGPKTEQAGHEKSASELGEGVASIASILNKHGEGGAVLRDAEQR